MRLIASSFLRLFLPLILASCSSSGTSEAPQPSPSTVTAPASPAPAGLLWRTHSTLFRGQTNGSGVVSLVDAAGFDPFIIFLSDSTVVYHITAAPLPPVNFGLTDIWQVQTSGTGRQTVIATADAEIIRDVFAPWVIYEQVVYTQGSLPSSTHRSARLDGPGQGFVTATPAVYRLHIGERAVFERIAESGGGGIFSVLLDGTDVRPLADVPSGSVDVFLTPVGTVGNQVLFTEEARRQNIYNIFAVPVTGGAVTPLTQGSDYNSVSEIVGSRIVYQRCQLIPHPDPRETRPIVGPCDIYSVSSNGSGTVPLATHPDMETVQGIIGSQVIFRRNGGAVDSVYSIPAGGGTETFMLTLSAQNEFLSFIVGDRVILRRSTGLWSLKADGGGLVQLTSDASDTPNGVAGPFICFQHGPFSQPDLWCVPGDGSGPATHVATGAFFVRGL